MVPVNSPMPTVAAVAAVAAGLPPCPQQQQQPHNNQRNKSSVLRSFVMNRWNASDADLATSPTRPSGPLEETSHNRQQEQHSPAKSVILTNNQHRRGFSASPSKKSRIAMDVFGSQDVPQDDASSGQSKKNRSSGHFVGLLTRSKSVKGTSQTEQSAAAETDETTTTGSGSKKKNKSRRAKDKENCSPSSWDVFGRDGHPSPVTPIFSQFCSNNNGSGSGNNNNNNSNDSSAGRMAAKSVTSRPSQDDPSARGRQLANSTRPKSMHPILSSGSKTSSGMPGMRSPMSPMAAAFLTARSMRQGSGGSGGDVSDSFIDPKEIDAHLEALLDRRNIPENQRYKMRNLSNTIKMEFIRQDWAEDRAKKNSNESLRPAMGTAEAAATTAAAANTAPESPSKGSKANKASKSSKSKHSRVRSMTLSKVTRGRSRDRDGDNGDTSRRHKSPGLGLRKKAEDTLGRHLRTKSTENIANALQTDTTDTWAASSSTTGGGNGFVALFKAKTPHHTPGDFVQYLRTVQQPEQVEVGKLHKLRLLLRNETVAWTEEFIEQGGMEETVGLLHRILAIEWREEHEDALLHENLLCLKALCTTELARQYLHATHASLLPALIHMIFDPEKKGPSEFTTRSIVTWVLFTYIQSAGGPEERTIRAQTVLGYLRDPEGDEADRPVSFVLDMRRERPYRVWCKEVVNVTKEVFWIFLHHLNVIALPSAPKKRVVSENCQPLGDTDSEDEEACAAAPPVPAHASAGTAAASYMMRNFPQERPPVPAAPYVGGVEWDATNYLASHLDLVNAIMACLTTATERNHLRLQMQMSGWERCMGSSLRLCKEKFYGAVHDGLRTWVAAAHEDGWDTRDVRYGPSSRARAQSTDRQEEEKKKASSSVVVGGPLAEVAAPKIDIPKIDFILDAEGL